MGEWFLCICYQGGREKRGENIGEEGGGDGYSVSECFGGARELNLKL